MAALLNPYAEAYARITGAGSIEEAFRRDCGVGAYVAWMERKWGDLLAARSERGLHGPPTFEDVLSHLDQNSHDSAARPRT